MEGQNPPGQAVQKAAEWQINQIRRELEFHKEQADWYKQQTKQIVADNLQTADRLKVKDDSTGRDFKDKAERCTALKAFGDETKKVFKDFDILLQDVQKQGENFQRKKENLIIENEKLKKEMLTLEHEMRQLQFKTCPSWDNDSS